ncbi:hypothetical protein BGW80DRAFT_1457948 [Lactifluus volemus]|nr:hypothetical protein BGW80DRAFT_1457948 [Lactifluus volemus]
MNTSQRAPSPPKATPYSHDSSSGFVSQPHDTSSRPANVHQHHDTMMDPGPQQEQARPTREDESHEMVETRKRPSTKRPEIATDVSLLEDPLESTPIEETFYEPTDVPAPEDTSEFDSKAATLHRTEQPSTGTVDPQSTLDAPSVSKSYSRVARDNVPPISRTKTLPPDQQSLPIILVSPENVHPVQTSRKRGDGSSNHPEVLDPRHSPMEDRSHSLKLPSLPPGTSSQSSLSSSVPSAALKRTSSEMRSMKDTPSGERSGTLESVHRSTAHSDANKGIHSASRYGRSHPNLPDAMHERVTKAEHPSPHPSSPGPPRPDKSASHYHPPLQRRTKSSFVGGTASPDLSSPPGGSIARTVSTHPRVGTSEFGRFLPDNVRSWDGTKGLPPPPPKARFSQPDQPSNKTSVEPSSSMGISREWSQIPMKSHRRIESPSDRVEHDHPCSLPSLSRQHSTYAHLSHGGATVAPTSDSPRRRPAHPSDPSPSRPPLSTPDEGRGGFFSPPPTMSAMAEMIMRSPDQPVMGVRNYVPGSSSDQDHRCRCILM